MRLFLTRSENPTFTERTEERVLAGFGRQEFGTSTFGIGQRETIPISKFYNADYRQSLLYTRKMSETGHWEAEVPGDFDLHNWLEADAYILPEDEDEVFYKGEVRDFTHDSSNNIIRISGPDIGGELQREPGEAEYEHELAWKILRDYIEDHVDGWDYDINPPEINQLTRNLVLQDVEGAEELEEAVDFGRTDPFYIQSNAIQTHDTAFTMEGSTFRDSDLSGDNAFDDGIVNSTLFSAHTGVRLTLGDSVEYEFDPQYTIPQIRVAMRLRASNSPRVEMTVGDSDPLVIAREGTATGLLWRDFRFFDPEWSNVSGSTRVRIEAVSGPDPNLSTSYFDIDVIAPRDLRYKVTYDNEGTRDSDGVLYLEGPETKPFNAAFKTERVTTDRNIERIEVNADFDDVSHGQAMFASNDERVYDGPHNSGSLDIELDRTYGFGADIIYRLSRVGRRESQTPLRGFESQKLTGWRLRVDTNDAAIFEDVELKDSHIRNIQEIADRANIKFYWPIDQRKIIAFHDGQSQQGLGLSESEYGEIESSKSTGADYANHVKVFGKRIDGRRVFGDARNEEEITELNAVVSHSEIRAEVESATEAQATANEILEKRIEEREFSGSIRDANLENPKHIHPAVEYFIPRWNRYATLHEIEVTNSGALLDFGTATDTLIARLLDVQERTNTSHKAQ